MRYKIIIQPEAAFDLQRLAKSEPKAFAKANRFIQELAEHPKTGLGHSTSTAPRPASVMSNCCSVVPALLSILPCKTSPRSSASPQTI